MAEIQIIRSTSAVVVVGEVDFDNLLEQARESEKLRTELSARLQQLEEIRQASLTWAMACPHHCEACNAMYEIIKGAQHPKTD